MCGKQQVQFCVYPTWKGELPFADHPGVKNRVVPRIRTISTTREDALAFGYNQGEKQALAKALTLYKKVGRKVNPVNQPLENGVKPGGFEERVEPAAFVPGSRFTKERMDAMAVGNGNLTPIEKAAARALLMEFEDCFAFDNRDRGTLRPEVEPPVAIATIPHNPWQKFQPRMSQAQMEKARRIFEDELENGMLERSMGPYRNAWFLVPKKNGKDRLIIDLQPLNGVTLRDAAIPPNAEEISQSLAGLVCTSSFDLFSGYDGIPLAKLCRDMAAILTPLGLLQKTTLPQGFTNSVAICQRIMCKVLRKWIASGKVHVFIDDFAIKGPVSDYGDACNTHGIRIWVQEHLDNIRGVLTDLRDSGLTASALKTQLCVPELEILSYVVNKEGRRPVAKKLAKIEDWRACGSVSETRAFIGLCVCFRKWVQGFVHIMQPLYDLLKKDARFRWGDEQQSAMDEIKARFRENLTLAVPDYTEGAPLLVVTADGGPQGWGAILSQDKESAGGKPERRVIEFESGFFNATEQRYNQLKREALALCKALKKFKYYVHGRHFQVETDAATLIWLINQVPTDLPNAVMTRWLTWIRLFDFEAVHIKGKTNIIADGLSRKPFVALEVDPDFEDFLDAEDGLIIKAGKGLCANHIFALQDVRREEFTDEDCFFDADQYQGGWIPLGIYKATLRLPKDMTPAQKRALIAKAERYVLSGGLLYEIISPRGNKHQVPKRVVGLTESRERILKACHDQLGHRGREATFHQISERYTWERLYSQVEAYIKSCEECQKRSKHQYGTIVHPQYTSTVFSRINMDIVKIGDDGIGGEKPVRQLISARCDLSGWIEARAVWHGTSSEVALFVQEDIVHRHGLPIVVVVDGGSEFKGELTNLLENLGVYRVVTSAYHPQANGMIENGHKSVLNGLAKGLKDQDSTDTWERHLSAVLWADRITAKRTTGESPFMLVYGRQALLPIHFQEETFGPWNWGAIETTQQLLAIRTLQIEYAAEN